MANCNENVIFNSKCTKKYLVAWLRPGLLTGSLQRSSDPLAGTGKGKGWDLNGGDGKTSGNEERVRKEGRDSYG